MRQPRQYTNHKYGDTDFVSSDVKILNDILNRQGHSLFIDVMAEHIGKVAIKYKLNDTECAAMRDSTLNELKDAINDRI